MANAFRLKASTMFSRMDDEVNESPLRIVFYLLREIKRRGNTLNILKSIEINLA